jgi:hypothetical protein
MKLMPMMAAHVPFRPLISRAGRRARSVQAETAMETCKEVRSMTNTFFLGESSSHRFDRHRCGRIGSSHRYRIMVQNTWDVRWPIAGTMPVSYANAPHPPVRRGIDLRSSEEGVEQVSEAIGRSERRPAHRNLN